MAGFNVFIARSLILVCFTLFFISAGSSSILFRGAKVGSLQDRSICGIISSCDTCKGPGCQCSVRFFGANCCYCKS
ncbi:hypothetical protein KI387_004902, partial [Taxus chinensis]